MTAYAVNKICHLSERDSALRERLRADPEGATSDFKLSDEERRALLAGDVATLFRLGAHPFLMQHLARHRLFGLDRDLYRERITSRKDER